MYDIKLTPAQIVQASWAIGGMEDYVGGSDGCNYEAADLPTLNGDVLTFPNVASVPDILYRLDVQVPDMASGADTEAQGRGCVRAAANLAAKIRAATKYVGPVWLGPEFEEKWDGTSQETK